MSSSGPERHTLTMSHVACCVIWHHNQQRARRFKPERVLCYDCYAMSESARLPVT